MSEHLLHPIKPSLLDFDDGSCRDVNFAKPTWDGVRRLSNRLLSEYRIESAIDGQGESLCTSGSDGVLDWLRKSDSVRLILVRGPSPIRSLQVFIYREPDGSPFVELTFFPEDVVDSQTLECDFPTWVRELRDGLGATASYARYENASWAFGDTSAESGVFLVSGPIGPGPRSKTEATGESAIQHDDEG